MKLSPSAAAGAALLAIATAACGGGGTSTPHTTPTSTPPPMNTKALWIANGANVVEFATTQLVAGTSNPAPHAAINSGVFGAPQGVQFDAAGDLWVIDGGTAVAGGTVKPALDMFTPTQLAALGTNPAPTPAIVIQSAGFTFPQQAVFDGKGNLWVTDNGGAIVDEFTPAQLAAGGANVAPNATITSSTPFTGPLGIAFSPTGNLWIANNGGTTLFEFNAGSLPATGAVTLTPNVVLADNGHGSIQAPWALVFDANGNLWSSNANTPFTIVEFSAANIAASGSPNPSVTLSPTTVNGSTTLAAPNGIAFDTIGDLAAISSATPFGVADFFANQLVAGGAVAPGAFLVGPTTTLNAPAGDEFGPMY